MIKVSDYNQELHSLIHAGQSGKYYIRKFTCKKYKTEYTYDVVNGAFIPGVLDGDFKSAQIMEEGKEDPWMSSIPEEEDSYKPFVELARGRVLSCGLGVGLLTVLLKPKIKAGAITQLDIVEYNQDVINLSWEHQKGPNINLIRDNAWSYLNHTNNRYDSIFLDIFYDKVEAIAEGPKMAKIAQQCLAPGGAIRYWLQEIREHLLPDRGPRVESSVPCKICCKAPHMNFYGGLCLTCAEVYEYWKPFE